MKYRKYDPKKDKEAVFRILNEVGWVSDKKEDKFLNNTLEKENTIVMDLNGEPEVMVVSSHGTMQYLEEELKLSAITGVTASLIARKQGFSGKLTAAKIAEDALAGFEISTLTIFDQGYYDKLGFGTGNVNRIIKFSPSTLKIKRKIPNPERLSEKDLDLVYDSIKRRMKCHGLVTLSKNITKSDIPDTKRGLGLGFKNEKGELTHHLWFSGKGKEEGPIWVNWMAYENYDQLMDLLALLKSFEEQYKLVRMIEPPKINFQDFIEKPFLYKTISLGSKYENRFLGTAFYQHRILNLEKCMEKTHLNCDDISFNLDLTDPIEKYLEDSKWRGISGSYIVKFGKNSHAEKGKNEELPTIKCSVNAFTRLWLGIVPASVLTITNQFEAPQTLIKKLDKNMILPPHFTNWSY